MAERSFPSGTVRTCVGCRVRAAKSDLLRLVVIGNQVVPDHRGGVPGRGAYVHPDPGCLELAVRRRAFPRAFRHAGPLDISPLAQHLEVWQHAGQARWQERHE
jgi:hypothetical protein